MYAVVRTGGKQYRVEPGNTVDIELVEGTVGETVTFSDVLLVENGGKVQIGRPTETDNLQEAAPPRTAAEKRSPAGADDRSC